MTDTSDESLDRLYHLWIDYRFYIIISVLMVMSAITGGAYQATSQQAAQQQSSEALFRVLQAVEDENLPAAKQALADIDGDEFPHIHNLAQMSLASLQQETGDLDGAIDSINQSIEQEDDVGMRQVMALRLVELLINAERYEDALSVLEEQPPQEEVMQMLFNERRADVYFAYGKHLLARSFYLQALQIAVNRAPSHAPLLNLKIGAASAHVIETKFEAKIEGKPSENSSADSEKESSQ